MTKYLLTLLLILPLTLRAQEPPLTSQPSPFSSQPSPLSSKPSSLSSIDLSLTLGSTGIGLDLGVSINDWLTVRAGANYMPRVNIPFEYAYTVGDITGGSAEELVANKSKLNKMYDLMYTITGTKMKRGIDMDRHTTMDNVHLLFDLYPLKNKHWHATAGFYYGSRTFAYGVNTLADAVTFSCISMYNEMYRKAVNNEPLISSNGTAFPDDIRQKFLSYGQAHVYLGHFTHDIYADDGHLIAKEGDTFYMEPDADCEITADARVNRFRPYLGIGYEGQLTRHDPHWRIGFNAGAMFWGGIPSVIVKYKEPTLSSQPVYHEINLMDDVTDLPYYAQKEANLVGALPVYPVLELRLSYRF